MDNEKKSDFELINAMEEIVVQKATDTLKYDKEVCTCEKCFYDICAIALNNLKPRYSTTQVGNLYARVSHLDQNDLVQISIEIAKALELVKARPSH